MTTIRKIKRFDETQEKWATCVKRVEQFFLGNIIDDNHQVPTLSSISGKTYTLLRDLPTPEKPTTKSFQEIITTLQQHLSPLEIAERFCSMLDNSQTTQVLPPLLNPTATCNTCYQRGGDSHATHNCRFKDQTCYPCWKVGHIAEVCCLKLQGKPKRC